MKSYQNDTSTFSFKELLEMKEKKPVDLMPPPRAPIRTMKDIIQELKKNLVETPSNAKQNLQLQEELNKIKMMNKENSYNNNNALSTNKYNNLFNSLNNISNNNVNNSINNNENEALLTDYETCLNNISNNNVNNNINNNENEASLTDFETCLNNNSHNSHNNEQILDEDNPLNLSFDNVKEKEKEAYIKFNKLPIPKNKSEIKIFVNNIICYINALLSYPSIKNNNKLNDDLFIFKYKLEIRYNDYRNYGLNEQYFINKLNQSQEELINKLKETIKNEKKEDNLNVGSMNINNIINVHNNYFFMGKKRKKSLSEIKSITDGSSSYEEEGN